MKQLFLFEADLKSEDYDFEADGKKLKGTSHHFQLCDDLSFKFGYKGKLKIKEDAYKALADYLVSGNDDKVPVLGADKFGNIIIKRYVIKNSIIYV